MTTANYLEATAFLQFVLQEIGWDESRKKIENSKRLISSRLLRVEVGRTLSNDRIIRQVLKLT